MKRLIVFIVAICGMGVFACYWVFASLHSAPPSNTPVFTAGYTGDNLLDDALHNKIASIRVEDAEDHGVYNVSLKDGQNRCLQGAPYDQLSTRDKTIVNGSNIVVHHAGPPLKNSKFVSIVFPILALGCGAVALVILVQWVRNRLKRRCLPSGDVA